MSFTGISIVKTRAWANHLITLMLAVILTFILGRAGTWAGIANPSVTRLALPVLGLLVITWILARVRHHSTWHRTPLDRPLIYWLVAFGISTVANWSALPNIATGLWFVGLYILVWYMIYDLRANRLLNSDQIQMALLGAGLLVLFSAFVEPVTASGRRAGMLQNPNILATFLILIVFILLERIAKLSGSAWTRAAYVLYGAAALVALYLTRSRGAFLGVFAGLGVVPYMKARWRITRILLLLGGFVIALALLAIRGDEGRVMIYQRALLFETRAPLTGQGLFTFRTGPIIAALDVPDGQALHTYNTMLQVDVELGVIGVIALLASLVQVFRMVEKQAWPKQQWVVAAIMGLLTQQMIDFTIMTASIALCAILLLSSVEVEAEGSGDSKRWPVMILSGLAVLLLVVGAVAGRVDPHLLQ